MDRLQQAEQDLNRLIHISERLATDLPLSQCEHMKRTNERRRERLQDLFTSCQQVRGEYEHLMKTQHKLNEDLLSTIDWFRRMLHDLQQPLELNLSLNNIVDFQQSLKVNFSCGRDESIGFDFVANRTIDRSTYGTN